MLWLETGPWIVGEEINPSNGTGSGRRVETLLAERFAVCVEAAGIGVVMLVGMHAARRGGVSVGREELEDDIAGGGDPDCRTSSDRLDLESGRDSRFDNERIESSDGGGEEIRGS